LNVIWSNEQYFSFGFTASSFPNIASCKSALIADKTLAYDATALLTAAFKGVHLIIQQQLLVWEVFMVTRHASNATATRDYVINRNFDWDNSTRIANN
jgi:hypothetical protein